MHKGQLIMSTSYKQSDITYMRDLLWILEDQYIIIKINYIIMATWQRKEFKNPEGGLNAKGVSQYKKENPGSKLKMGVDKTPKTPEEIRRQGQFLTRFYGRKDLPPLVDDK